MHCSDYYWNHRELNKHRNMHTDVEYKCELCEQAFFNRDLLYAHVMSHHSKKKKTNAKENFICEICDKVFTSKGSIRNHVQLHTSELCSIQLL